MIILSDYFVLIFQDER